LLKRSVKEEKSMKPSPNWRINNKNFLKKNSMQELEPGAVNFSAGWLGQGHTVWVIFHDVVVINSLVI
jgi:hypothetical protein